MSDACVARFVKAVDPHSKVPGSNPGTVEITGENKKS